MDQQRCPKCGRKSEADSAFCPYCGAPFTATAAVQRAAEQPAGQRHQAGPLRVVLIVIGTLVFLLLCGEPLLRGCALGLDRALSDLQATSTPAAVTRSRAMLPRAARTVAAGPIPIHRV